MAKSKYRQLVSWVEDDQLNPYWLTVYKEPVLLLRLPGAGMETTRSQSCMAVPDETGWYVYFKYER